MNSAIEQFRGNIARSRDLGNLASQVAKITTAAIDVSDMWRAQIVLGVSAFDHFIHELTRLGMIECAKGVRAKTDAFRRFQLPLEAAEGALNGQPHEVWLGETVREKHSFLSFQQPDKIADAIRLMSGVKLWDDVGAELGLSAANAKLRLALVVDRRNKIAHEADMNPTYPGFRWSITAVDASDALDYVEKVAEAIFKRAV